MNRRESYPFTSNKKKRDKKSMRETKRNRMLSFKKEKLVEQNRVGGKRWP